MRRQKLLSWFSSGYGQIAVIFPFVVAAPRYFSGAFELGQLIQTAQAFGQVQSALSWFVSSYADVAEWKATVNRLSGFEEALEKTAKIRVKSLSFREEPGAMALTVSHVNIYLPSGAPLMLDLSLELPARSHVLISGPSGIGKSTFLRTLAGIWPYCDGSITLPAGERTLFLPQKLYLPLGTLRDALSYPDAAGKYSERNVRAALTSCGLSSFANRLDEKENWALQLSLGEQQRIAFACALLLRPQWLFLDEATSALDEEAEATLYTLLLESVKYCSVISVAHRSSLARFHGRQLVFSRGADLGRAGTTFIELTEGFARGAE